MPTIDYGGGVEKNFFVITNYLSTKFKKITVVTLSQAVKTKLNNKVNIICPKISFIHYLGRRLRFIVALVYLLQTILVNKKPTVFCFQGIIYCTLLCKIIGTKIIVRSNSSPSGWSNNFIKMILYKKIYSFADTIVVNSLNFKKEIKKKFNLESVCIYNPLNKIEVLKNSKKEINFNFFNKKYLNLVSVARFVEQKDHECLVRAINLIKNKSNIKLLLIGSGNLKKKISYLIKKFKLSKNIKIIDYQKNPFPFIKMSDVFVLSSKYEGSPNVLLEAITLNKLIISSDCPTGPKEILDGGKGGILFKVGDYKRLSNIIQFLEKKNKKFNKLKTHAKKRLYRFDYKKRLDDYFKIVST